MDFFRIVSICDLSLSWHNSSPQLKIPSSATGEGQRCDKMGIIRDEWIHEKEKEEKKEKERLTFFWWPEPGGWRWWLCGSFNITGDEYHNHVLWFSCFSDTHNVRIQCLFLLISEPKLGLQIHVNDLYKPTKTCSLMWISHQICLSGSFRPFTGS